MIKSGTAKENCFSGSGLKIFPKIFTLVNYDFNFASLDPDEDKNKNPARSPDNEFPFQSSTLRDKLNRYGP
jgi:hypothetical protein